jgi:hypothetical protein
VWSSPAERLKLSQTRATGLLLLGEDAGWQEASEIPQSASGSAEQRIIAAAMTNMGELAIVWGRYAEARSRLDRAIELLQTTGYRRVLSVARVARAHLDWCIGAWAGLTETVAELAETLGIERTMSVGLDARSIDGLLQLAAGSLRAAEQRLRAVVEELVSCGLVNPEAGLPAAGLGRLHLGRVPWIMERGLGARS